MKRILSALLLLSLLLPLVSCTPALVKPTTAETATAEQQTSSAGQNQTEPSQTKKVPKPLTWDMIDAIPIANDSMSIDEIRKICTDFFRLQNTFQWTPSKNCSYVIRTGNKTVSFQAGHLYGGIPYAAPGPGGNLYLWMEYYDSETGVLDVNTTPSVTLIPMLGNHCSHAFFWSWGRAVNTISTRGTRTFTPKNGCIPVGEYRSDLVTKEWSGDGVNGEPATDLVCKANGEQVMYRSYAKLLIADGIVTNNSRGSGHVVMASSVPHVVTNPDGTINGKESYLTILEQTSPQHAYVNPDGVTQTVQGGIDLKKTFEELYKADYIPFTCAEFLGKDPVEKATATVNLAPSDTVTLEALEKAVLSTNYPMSNITVKLFDENGKELLERRRRYVAEETGGNAIICKNYELIDIFRAFQTSLPQNPTGDVTIRILCRVSTGEELTAWESKLALS